MEEGLPNFKGQEDKKPNLDWESFWNENEKKIKEDLASSLEPFFASWGSDDKVQERLERALLLEREFSRTILETLENLSIENKKILVLFDVDETIGKGVYSEGNKFRTVIRPAFLAIMEKIKSFEDIQVGLLTTRGIPEQQLNDPENLEPIKKYINLDYIYSTRKIPDAFSDSEEDEKMREDKEGPIRQDLKEEDNIGASGAIKKLKILKDLKQSLRDTVLVAVDDDRYPAFLDKDRGYVGIQLGEKSAFWV